MTTHPFYERHRDLLQAAQQACRERSAFVPFQESPSAKHHPEGAKGRGQAAFESHLGGRFELDEHPGEYRLADEVSPYTMNPLGISYPFASAEQLFEASAAASTAWAIADPATRVGVCMEALTRLEEQTFQNAFATMHTSGQAFMMAFAGSGANSLDRGLEAIAYADAAMREVPRQATYQRSFGRGEPVSLEKRYRLRPRGVALVITCGSYPAWNAYPAVFANLATGNPVILKPHPLGVLPMAIAVKTIRETLADAGFDPNTIVLAVDRCEAPITNELFNDRRAAIVDFTGGQSYGSWLEQHAGPRLVYTETSGVNHVLLESVDELDPVLRAVAQGVAIFSGQMCTAPQNFLIPRTGVRTSTGIVHVDDLIHRFVAVLEELLARPPVAAAVCGAVQQDSTIRGVESVTAVSGLEVVRRPSGYEHPDFPSARTMTPAVLRASGGDPPLFSEVFGPVAVFIPVDDRDSMLDAAADAIRREGSIANYAYSTDDGYITTIEDAFASAGASVGINLVRQSPINFTAAFSDYHVTGLNPAGNACLTDSAFVSSRFRIVQSKRELR